jgi:pimeloyl-ACP methyl ester carboxylesterase
MWDELLSGLEAKDLAISTPSIPGHGTHHDLPAEHTAIAYCREIIKQIPADDLPWIVVGHSMGGYLASTLVTMAPHRIAALGLFHSKAGADNEQKIEDRRRAISAATANKDLYLSTMLRNTLAEQHTELYANELHAMIESAKADITADCIAAAQEVMIERPDNTRFLAQAPFPTFYFLGREDRSIVYEQVTAEIQCIPSAQVTLHENAGHMGHIECKKAALEWLERICTN